MEVLVGSTSYAASTAYVIDQTKDGSSSSPCLFLNGRDEEEDGGEIRNKRIGSGFLGKSPEEESSSSSSNNSGSSSSIGAPGDSEDEEEDGEVSSQAPGLTSLDALEDSLPIKRGLSNHYTGKSKSFGNLSDVSLSSISVKDLVEKPENALNKRRRVLIANKWARKSFYSWQNPKSMPLLASLNEDDDDDDDYCNNKEQIGGSNSSSSSSSNSRSDQQGGHKLKKHPFSFKSQSCFALADLQEEDDDEDEDDDDYQ